jgi:outer membrane immunogenic protein
MRFALLAGVAVALAGIGHSIAADMPVKAPPIVVPYSTWNGFYVGGNVGYGWGDPSTSLAASGTNISFPGVIPITNSLAFADSQTQPLRGVLGGAQFGYNYEFNRRWVLGFETDIQSGGQGSNNSAVPFSGAFCTTAINPPPTCTVTTPFNATATNSYAARIDWFGTVRGRLGFLLYDQFLVYGTGGLAYGRVSTSGTTFVQRVIGLRPVHFARHGLL